MPTRRKTWVTGVLALVVAAAATLATGAPAATPATIYDSAPVDSPDGQATGRWGERLAVAGDVNDDGVNDFFVGAPSHTLGDLDDAGRVLLMSGRTNAVLYRIDSPEPQANARFGFFISAFGDVDRDNELDIAIGTDAQSVGDNNRQGKAWVFSGRSGKLLYALDNPDPQADGRFGSRIGTAGDVTGDGVSDVLVGASNNDIPADCGNVPTTTPPTPLPAGCRRNIGQAYVFHGVSGALVRELNVPDADQLLLGPSSSGGSFGIAVQSPGDTNGDGVADQLVGASSYAGVGRMYVFDGATGEVRLRIDSPQPQPGSSFGFQDAAPGSPGDVNRDGRADLYGNGFLHNGAAGEGQGRGWIFDGRNGVVIRALDDPTPSRGGQFGWSLAGTDFNKDGVSDQYIGQAPHHVPGGEQDGGTYVFDGRNGDVLKALELPAFDRGQASTETNGGPRLGWSLAAPGDLNGDGEPDYIAGAPFADVGGAQDQGRVYVYLSRAPAAAPKPTPTPAPQQPTAAGRFTAKLSLARATINRRERVLDVLAPITARASGRVRVELHAARQRFRFTAPIDSANGRIRFRQRIPAAQARLGTGIITISYAGDADTRPQTVRLRAANRPAILRLGRPRIVNGRVLAAGTVNPLARGVVRLQLEYDHGGRTRVVRFRAQIRDGRWSLDERVSTAERIRMGQRRGTLHSYTLFTGLFQKRMRGEMRSFQVLGDR